MVLVNPIYCAWCFSKASNEAKAAPLVNAFRCI